MPATEAIVDRKSTRLNSSHPSISYAVFCLKTKPDVHWGIGATVVSVIPTNGAIFRSEDQARKQLMNVAQLHFIFKWVAAFFFFNWAAATNVDTLSLHDALPI